MLAGARVDVAPYKRGDMDFVLWKPSKESEPGWEAPWGRGRPGGHIECSAMSWAHLGETFDIHGGGIDLVFPHHENEIAQSCCAFDRPVMANYWMHNGFLQVEGEKMSKSLGNFVTIHELLHTEKFGGQEWDGAVLRLAMLRTHYRQPIDWTVRALEEAHTTCVEWHVSTFGVPSRRAAASEVIDALTDDLNTAAAFATMHRLHKDALRGDQEAAIALKASMELLGIKPDPRFDKYLLLKRSVDVPTTPALEELRARELSEFFALIGKSQQEIETLITARLAARAAKNWAESDRIRDELAAMGIALKDNKDGTTTWEVKR